MEIPNKIDSNNKSFYRRNKKKIKRTVYFVVALVFFSGGFIGSKILQSKGYNGLWDFAKTITSNYWKGLDAQPESISIEIKDKDYKFLEKKRNVAIERGIIINDIDGDYVPAELNYNGKKIKIKLRLKGHMTDHLQENKWSFRIKVKDKDSFMGMKRFSIQHPGTRGYIYEWIFHELMKKEDVIALRYKFVNVTVNGRDWGIYAVEENFENELIDNNSRKRGPILRFNPNLYWVHRYNMMQKQPSSDEYASYYSSNLEAYREDDVLSDSSQRTSYLKAMALVEGLRNKQISVDQVFDIERLAKFHAIIDLVGGENSIDWSDVKYYYNPITQKLEPVAYESFTNFTMRNIAGAYKFVEIDSIDSFEDWHTTLFSNPVFFKSYIGHLERVSSPKYLDEFFNESNVELEKNLAIICKEFPYKKFDKSSYYRNLKMIRKILDAPKSFHAYYKSISDNEIHLQLGSIESLPIEIKSLSVDGKIALPKKTTILVSKKKDKNVVYKEVVFMLPAGVRWNDSLAQSMNVNYCVLGSKNVRETIVFPFPHTDSEFISVDIKNKNSTINNFSFLEINESAKSIYINSGKHIVLSDLIIPEGYKVIANSGVSIDIKNSAKIISYSSLFFEGSEDEQIQVESSDSSSKGILIINAPQSIFKFVSFKNLPKVNESDWARSGAITFYESQVEFINCSFFKSKAEDAINLIRSPFSFVECLFQEMNDDALDIDFSDGTIDNCVFENCKENALDITKGNIKVSNIYIDGIGNKAVNVKAGASFKGKDIKIQNSKIGVSAEDLCTVELEKIAILNSEIGIVAYENKKGAGHPTININNIVLTQVKKNYLKEKKSIINVNAESVGDEVDNIEAIIKSDKKKSK